MVSTTCTARMSGGYRHPPDAGTLRQDRTFCSTTFRPRCARDRDRGRRRGPGAGAVHDRRRVGDLGEPPRAGLPEPPPAAPADPAAGAEAPGLRPRPPAGCWTGPRLAARHPGPAPNARPGHPLEQLELLRNTDPAVAAADLEQLRALHPESAAARISPQQYAVRTAEALAGLVDRRPRAALGPHRRHPARRHRTTRRCWPPAGWPRRCPCCTATSPSPSQLRRRPRDGQVAAAARGQGLWFLPSVFRWPWVALDTRDGAAVVSYGARGSGRVWQRPGRETPAGAARPDRAHPRADPRAARRALLHDRAGASLGLSISTVSEHLTVMAASGLLQSRRDGQRVLYWRTNVGDLLVDGEDAASSRAEPAKVRSHPAGGEGGGDSIRLDNTMSGGRVPPRTYDERRDRGAPRWSSCESAAAKARSRPRLAACPARWSTTPTAGSARARRSSSNGAATAPSRRGIARPGAAGSPSRGDHRGVLDRGRSYAEPRGPRDRCGAPVLPGRGLPGAGAVHRPAAGASRGRLGLRAGGALPLPPAGRDQRLPAAVVVRYLRADSAVGVTTLFSSKCMGSV